MHSSRSDENGSPNSSESVCELCVAWLKFWKKLLEKVKNKRIYHKWDIAQKKRFCNLFGTTEWKKCPKFYKNCSIWQWNWSVRTSWKPPRTNGRKDVPAMLTVSRSDIFKAVWESLHCRFQELYSGLSIYFNRALTPFCGKYALKVLCGWGKQEIFNKPCFLFSLSSAQSIK